MMHLILFEVVFQKKIGGFLVRCRSELIGGRTVWHEVPQKRLVELAQRLNGQAFDQAARDKQVKLGQEVFDLLFQGDNRRLFDRARGEAAGLEKSFLLRLCLEDDPVVAAVPWELMHDGFSFLAKGAHCSIVRTLEDSGLVRSRDLQAPLRVLLTSGICRPGESVDLEKQRQAVEKARGKDSRIDRPVVRRRVSWGDLEELLTPGSEGFHIWMHFGHGGFIGSDPGCYCLLLNGEIEPEAVPAGRISELAIRCPELTLIFLACGDGGEYRGLASHLARLQVPIVLGFPWEVGLSTAGRLAVTLLRGLKSLPPEVACSTARSALSAWAPDSLEWSWPLLFSRRSAMEPLLAPTGISLQHNDKQVINVGVGNIVSDSVKITGSTGTHESTDCDVDVKANEIKTHDLIVYGKEERLHRQALMDLLKDLERTGGVSHE